MIVEPGFLDHWKPNELAARLDDPNAGWMILRLWAYCQQRKQWQFDNLPVFAVARICRFGGDAEKLVGILLELKILDRYKKGFAIHDWEKSNGSLISAWKNGLKGGRPSKHKTGRISDRIPEGYSGAITPPSNLILSNPISSSKSSNGEVQEGKKPDLAPRFEDIYNAYPRHEAKPAALSAIAKAIKRGHGAAYLLERTLAYAKTQPKGSQYTPHPATWFNQDRFNDDPAEWSRAENVKPQSEKEIRCDRERKEAEQRLALKKGVKYD